MKLEFEKTDNIGEYDNSVAPSPGVQKMTERSTIWIFKKIVTKWKKNFNFRKHLNFKNEDLKTFYLRIDDMIGEKDDYQNKCWNDNYDPEKVG